MDNKDIARTVTPSVSMSKAALGFQPDDTSVTARLLSMTAAAGGAELIAPNSLVKGETPRLIGCASIWPARHR